MFVSLVIPVGLWSAQWNNSKLSVR